MAEEYVLMVGSAHAVIDNSTHFYGSPQKISPDELHEVETNNSVLYQKRVVREGPVDNPNMELESWKVYGEIVEEDPIETLDSPPFESPPSELVGHNFSGRKRATVEHIPEEDVYREHIEEIIGKREEVENPWVTYKPDFSK